MTPAYAVLAVARFYAGDLDGVVDAARLAGEHHQASRRIPAHLMAHAMLALAEFERGRQASARRALSAAQQLAGESGLTETWPGALVAGAAAAGYADEGNLPMAEREASRSARLPDGVPRRVSPGASD